MSLLHDLDSSPAALVHAVFQALKARTLSDRPLPTGHAGNKDGKGDCGNNNGPQLDHPPDQDDPPLPPPKQWCDGNKGGGQVNAKATKRAMAMAMRVASNKDGNGNSGKSDGDGDEIVG
jgi:hypothetical protein